MGQKPDEVGRLTPSSAKRDEPEEIRADIAQTRVEMSRTIDAIQEKLDPERIKNQAKEAIREATVGRAEETVSNIYETAEEAVYTARETAMEASNTMMDTVRRNPFPSLLAGVGLSWLFMNRSPKRRSYKSYYSEGADPYGYGRSRTSSGQGSGGGLGEVTDRMQETASRAQERAGQVASNATETVRDAGSGVGDLVRQNPLPTALISLGLGWLLMNSGSSRTTRYPQYGLDYTNYDYETAGYHYEEESGGRVDEIRERAGETVGKATDAVTGIAGQAQDTAGQVVNQAQETVGQVADELGDRANYVARQTQYQARRVEDSIQEMLRTNPLAIGAAAVAVGAALGMALPRTQQEQSLMGDASEKFVEKVRTTADDVMQKAQRVAGEVQDTTQEQMRKEGLS